MSSGVTAFFRHLPIFPNSAATSAVAVEEADRRCSTTSLGLDVEAPLVGVGGGLDHALVEQALERLLGATWPRSKSTLCQKRA